LPRQLSGAGVSACQPVDVEGVIPNNSVSNFDGIFFDDGVGQDVVRKRLEIFLRLLTRNTVSNRDVETFTLPDIGDSAVAQTIQRRPNGLALRIEYSGLEENEDSCFHQNHDYRTRDRLLRAKAMASMAMPTVEDVIGSGTEAMLEPRICTITSCAPT
jgi:hypothetical protein